MTAPIFTWSAWESAFTQPDGEPEGVPTYISECTLDGKPTGSVMRFGTGRYTAFFPDQRHHSHIETEARAKGLVEQAAGGSVAPLDPRQIVRALCDSPRAATEEEVRHLVVALADEREGFGTLWQMRQRSLAALTLANERIARLEEALKFYSDVGDYTAPQTGYVYGGENKLWCDCGGTARAALKGGA